MILPLKSRIQPSSGLAALEKKHNAENFGELIVVVDAYIVVGDCNYELLPPPVLTNSYHNAMETGGSDTFFDRLQMRRYAEVESGLWMRAGLRS